eukprot:5756074-Pleurochrysis_carterae.AAC.1
MDAAAARGGGRGAAAATRTTTRADGRHHTADRTCAGGARPDTTRAQGGRGRARGLSGCAAGHVSRARRARRA